MKKNPDGQRCTRDVRGPGLRLQLLPRLRRQNPLDWIAVSECIGGISVVVLAFAVVAAVAFVDFVGSAVFGFAAGAVGADNFDFESARFGAVNYVDVVVG